MNLDRLYHLIRSVAGLTVVSIVCSLGLSVTYANAQEIMKTCAGMEARLINISAEFVKKVLLDTRPEIAIIPTPPSSTTPGAAGKAVTVIALGPVLGSMDSPTVETDLACTAKGVVLTATITRSADYHGAAAKNVLWRPKIEIAVVLRQPEGIFEATWRMRLTTGAEMDHARTPSYPDQKYPITVTTTVR